jgi:D-amino-acid dehydrogenase
LAGIVGLSSAYYLHEAGYKVTVFDKGDLSDNCSYGNAGYVCPSHFVPLAKTWDYLARNQMDV